MVDRFYLCLCPALFLLVNSCASAEKQNPDAGDLLRVSLQLSSASSQADGGVTLPFILEPDSLHPARYLIHNGAERLPTGDVLEDGDSVTVPLNLFRSYLRFSKLDLPEGGGKGYWHHERRGDYRIPLQIEQGVSSRFEGKVADHRNWLGEDWRVLFLSDSSSGIGRFREPGSGETLVPSTVVGTFLTPTGDYRYLEGDVMGDSLYLSCFDGSHAFLFTAARGEDGSLRGLFRSGKHWKTEWTAVPDASFSLPDPDELTVMRPGESSLDFCFDDLEGRTVCLTDSQYTGKVVLVQIMGSWCPNCMDETSFYREVYDPYHERGLEVISLAYEAGRERSSWQKGASRMLTHFDIPWTFLLAGPASKAYASESLPQLSGISSFPTSVFINREGEVARIHTGFSGPATGEDYRKFVEEFHQTMEELL